MSVDKAGDPREVHNTGDAHGTPRDAGSGHSQVWVTVARCG